MIGPVESGLVIAEYGVRLFECRTLDGPTTLTDAQMTHQFQSPDVVLGLDEQAHRQEPWSQRQLGVSEDRPSGHRRPIPATAALDISASVAEKSAASGTPERRTRKAVRPEQPLQRGNALLLGAVADHKLVQRQAFLASQPGSRWIDVREENSG